MEITLQVPDRLIDEVRVKIPPLETGILSTVAMKAVLAFLESYSETGTWDLPKEPPRA